MMRIDPDLAPLALSSTELFAAGATGVALIMFGVVMLAMQVGELLGGVAARNPAAAVVRSTCAIALATLGIELLLLIH